MQFQTKFGKGVLAASQKHAEAVYPEEAVGVVVKGRYVRLKNIHKKPEEYFAIDQAALLERYGWDDIQAVIHSHAVDRGSLYGPSEADMKAQITSKKAFGIQLVTAEGAGNIVWWGEGIEPLPYEGRPYLFGVYDCYSILRDWYAGELGIQLKDFARSEDFYKKGNDLFTQNAEKQGFIKQPDAGVRKLRRGDVVLLAIRSTVPNHCIVALGGGLGLHHATDTTSVIEPIGRLIDPDKPFFHSLYRHRDML